MGPATPDTITALAIDTTNATTLGVGGRGAHSSVEVYGQGWVLFGGQFETQSLMNDVWFWNKSTNSGWQLRTGLASLPSGQHGVYSGANVRPGGRRDTQGP
jgi:hypothetical protein